MHACSYRMVMISREEKGGGGETLNHFYEWVLKQYGVALYCNISRVSWPSHSSICNYWYFMYTWRQDENHTCLYAYLHFEVTNSMFNWQMFLVLQGYNEHLLRSTPWNVHCTWGRHHKGNQLLCFMSPFSSCIFSLQIMENYIVMYIHTCTHDCIGLLLLNKNKKIKSSPILYSSYVETTQLNTYQVAM